MRLGISSYTYVWAVGVPGYPAPQPPLTAVELLERAVRLGVRVVQIADNLPLDRLSGPERTALIEQARQLDIALEVGTCGICPAHLRRYLHLAREVGSDIVRVVADTEGHHPTPDEVVDALRTVMPEFERAGVRLAIENHDRFRAAALHDILERVGSEWAGICLDTANSIGGLERVETLVEVLGSRVMNLHLKDYCIFRPPHRKGFVVEGRPAGKGQLDIPGLLAQLRALRRDPNVILELWPPPGPTIDESAAREAEWAEQSIRYLRQFVPD
ncbi:MAG TPA: sugar phosphate isomerase/epimerase family protein [Gemmataceae bacterium]|nr:sugar phosphate isomerase/epimerase family protein [Gemmataceae bacterium]